MKPETSLQGGSILGSILMAAVGFGSFAIASWYLKLDWLTVFIITTIATIAFGLVYNFIATLRGTKKIHWLDFAFSFLPWDF